MPERVSHRRRSPSHRCGFTTNAGASCSKPSPNCRSTTSPERSAASCPRTRPRSPSSPIAALSSNSAQGAPKKHGSSSTPWWPRNSEHFVALDVSEEILVGSAAKVHAAYGVNVTAIVGDFHHHLGALPPGGRRLLAFLGSTIGNFEPEVRRGFLRNVAATMASGDRFLLGADLRKDAGRLIRAYDDAAGVTAEFNRNVLHVLNNELGADFAPERFEHVCVWDDSRSRIEMRLRAVQPELVSIPGIGMEVTFAEGEELLTEISTKFQPEQLISELRNCGLETEGTWTDEGGDFMLVLTRPST